jgi:hypothetical protein
MRAGSCSTDSAIAGWTQRLTGRLSVAAGLMVISMVVSGCGLFLPSTVEPAAPTGTPRPTVTATPTATATPVPPTPTPLPTATPVPSPTPVSISQGEAQTAVRAWFDALAAEDYVAMEALTADGATLHTRGLAEAIQLEATREGVDIDIVTRRLEMQPGSQPQQGAAVDTDFLMDINVRVGPFSFPARQMEGTATFIVGRVDRDVKIVDIQDVMGLPEL